MLCPQLLKWVLPRPAAFARVLLFVRAGHARCLPRLLSTKRNFFTSKPFMPRVGLSELIRSLRLPLGSTPSCCRGRSPCRTWKILGVESQGLPQGRPSRTPLSQARLHFNPGGVSIGSACFVAPSQLHQSPRGWHVLAEKEVLCLSKLPWSPETPF
jgi:hypothetical protein